MESIDREVTILLSFLVPNDPAVVDFTIAHKAAEMIFVRQAIFPHFLPGLS